MRKALYLAIVLSFVLAIAVPLSAAGQEMKCEMGKATCKKGVVFTDEQKAKLAELRLAMREKNVDLKAKLEKLGLEMRKEFDKPEPSAEVLGRIIDEMAAARSAMQKNGIELALATRRLMTPEQRAQMKECCPGGAMMEGMSPGCGHSCSAMGKAEHGKRGPGKAARWWMRDHRRPMGRAGHAGASCGAMMKGRERGGCCCCCAARMEGCMKGGGKCMKGAGTCMMGGEGCMKAMKEGCCSKEKDATGSCRKR